MLTLVLSVEVALLLFLVGVFFIAKVVTWRHGDSTATYQLYAVRDKLIEACVFKDVSRDDPWLDALYENVNTVLLHSNMLGGPPHWSLAVALGRYQAAHPGARKALIPLPVDQEKCPEAISAIAPALKKALEHLSVNHMGLMLQMSAHEREQRRIQRQKARALLQMMRGAADRCGCIA